MDCHLPTSCAEIHTNKHKSLLCSQLLLNVEPLAEEVWMGYSTQAQLYVPSKGQSVLTATIRIYLAFKTLTYSDCTVCTLWPQTHTQTYRPTVQIYGCDELQARQTLVLLQQKKWLTVCEYITYVNLQKHWWATNIQNTLQAVKVTLMAHQKMNCNIPHCYNTNTTTIGRNGMQENKLNISLHFQFQHSNIMYV